MPKKTKQQVKPEKKSKLRRLSIFHYKPHFVPLLTIMALLVMCAAGFGVIKYANRNKTAQVNRIVIISYDKQKQIVPSSQPTVKALLNKLSITLNKGDRVEPGLDTKIDQDQFRINIYRAVPIEIVDNNQKTFAFSAAATPRSIAEETGEVLYAEDDLTSIPTQSFIKDGALGQRIVIDRATPVSVDLWGNIVTMRTHAPTVGDLLKEKKIKLAKGDKLVPSAKTKVKPGMQLAILRTGKKVQAISEVIPMPVKQINDNNLAYGTSAIRQRGAPGKKVVTYQVTLHNNKIVAKKALDEVITQKPVVQIVVVGTSLSGIKGDMAYAGISPSDYKYVDYIVSRESGWCPTKAQGNAGNCPVYSGYVPSYGGYGLCQATPPGKMASAGSDWQTNPITQLKWCSGYAKGRYGSWAAAYNHWISYSWW